MFNKRKIGSRLNMAKPENRLFGLMRSEVAFQASPVNPESKNQEQCLQEFRIAVENAMLQAEYNRAKAAMTSQQIRSFY